MDIEKNYYELAKQGKTKKYFTNLQNFREALYDYQPSQIWLDGFSKDYPYVEGSYRDKKFSGAYVKQCGLTFHLDSLSELESIFKEGMYIYV
jgi:hypothetical protein